ncbi:META domain-containing protein [Pontibacter sp. HJ8]
MKHQLRYTYLVVLLILAGACTLQPKNRQFSEGVAGIQGSYWMLLSLQGQDLEGVPDTHTAYIRFEEGNDEVKGFAGCNRLTGRYQLRNDSLQLTNLSTTRMSCPNIEQENFMMKILDQVDSYEIAGDVLTLFHNKSAVATFQAGYPPSLINSDK